MSRIGGILVATGLTIAAVSALAQNDQHMMGESDSHMGSDHQGMMGEDHEGMMGGQGHGGKMMNNERGADESPHGMMDNGHDMPGRDGQ